MTEPSEQTPMTPERLRPILFGRRFDWVIAVTILVIAVLFIYLLQSLPQRATFFPWFITISIVLVGAIYAGGKWRQPDQWDDQYDPDADIGHGEIDTGPAFLLKYSKGILRTLAIFGCLIAATLMIGPEYAVPLFLALMLWVGGEGIVVGVLSGAGFWLVIHFVFGDFMSINLPTGYLSTALGL